MEAVDELDPMRKLYATLLHWCGCSPLDRGDVQNPSKGVGSAPGNVGNLVKIRDMKAFRTKYDAKQGTGLGSGAFGAVRTVRNIHTGDDFAMKMIAVDETVVWEDLENEINVQKMYVVAHHLSDPRTRPLGPIMLRSSNPPRCCDHPNFCLDNLPCTLRQDHPNICKIFEAFVSERHDQMLIIMELCTGGSLVSRMKTHHRYDEAAAATLLEKMLSAVLYLHNNGVIHRDIKLDNMVFDDEREDAELKLIDFGLSHTACHSSEMMSDQVGTPSYMAPELWADSRTPYDSSVDMWALGVVAYVLLSGTRPFHHPDSKQKTRMIREDPLSFPQAQWKDISEEAKDFCSALMRKRPRDRLTASQALRHPWIKKASNVHRGPTFARLLEQHEEAIQSLEAFAEKGDLEKLALQAIAFSTPPGKFEELRLIFRSMDQNLSGTIDFEEFRECFASRQIATEKLKKIFKSIDVAGNGKINYTEFLAAAIQPQQSLVARTSIKEAFDCLDRDGDAYITKDELAASLGRNLQAASEEEYMMHADEEGRMSFQAFGDIIAARPVEFTR